MAGGLGDVWRDPAISFRMFNRGRPDANIPVRFFTCPDVEKVSQ